MDLINAPWLGSLLGLLGVSFALYQIFKSRGPKLSSQYIGQALIRGDSSDLPGGLQIIYEEQPVSNLSVTQVALWNRGSSSIRGSDIVASDPLAISFGNGAEILKADVVKLTRPAINVSAEPDKASRSRMLITFEFLDPEDGALLKIWHTGPDPKPKLVGTIVGVPKGAEDLGRMPPRYSVSAIKRRSSGDPVLDAPLLLASMMYSRPLTVPLASTFLGMGGFTFLLSAPWLEIPLEPAAWWALLIGAVLYSFTGIYGVWGLRRRFPTSIAPDELRADPHQESGQGPSEA